MRMQRPRSSLAFAALAVVGAALFRTSGSGRAAADTGYVPPTGDAQATSLFKLKDAMKCDFTASGLKFKVGHAEIFVDAPVRTVRAAVLDYGSYQSYIPRFDKSKVLSKNGEAAKTYLQVPILHGAATFWAVENFSAPAAEGKGEKVVGVMEKGNMGDFKATWRFRAVDDKHAIVSLDIYLEPKLPVSSALVSEEERDAAADGVRGIKAHAEALAKQLASKP
jgi:ribosome-associated toxin RatA of RatAB toxin-antitoxin module